MKENSEEEVKKKRRAETEPLARKVLVDALIAVLVKHKVLDGQALRDLEAAYFALAQKRYSGRMEELQYWWSEDVNPLEALRVLELDELLDS